MGDWNSIYFWPWTPNACVQKVPFCTFCVLSKIFSLLCIFLCCIYLHIKSYTLYIECGIDSEPQLEEDEQLARALQESLNVESPQQRQSKIDNDATNGYGHGNENIYQPISVPYSTSFRYRLLTIQFRAYIYWISSSLPFFWYAVIFH